MNAAGLLRYARSKAGVSQRELGRRAGVSQTTISLIEDEKTSPRFETLERLLTTCGFELELVPLAGVGIDRTSMRNVLRLTPAERARIAVQEARNLARIPRLIPVSAPTAFNPIPVFKALTAHGVRFVVIGGFAGRLWGSNIVADDLDICYALDRKNYRALATALREMNARLSGRREEIPFLLDATAFESGDDFTFETNAGIVGCVGMPTGSQGFPDLIRGASEMDLDSVRVHVAALKDLIWLKRAAGRPKDLVEVEILAALREEIERAKQVAHT